MSEQCAGQVLRQWARQTFFDPIETQHLKQCSLILLFDIILASTKSIEKVCPGALILVIKLLSEQSL